MYIFQQARQSHFWFWLKYLLERFYNPVNVDGQVVFDKVDCQEIFKARKQLTLCTAVVIVYRLKHRPWNRQDCVF